MTLELSAQIRKVHPEEIEEILILASARLLTRIHSQRTREKPRADPTRLMSPAAADTLYSSYR